MSISPTVQELNRELARKLIEEGRTNPQSAYRGKYVGIANGRVVAVADSWDELARLLRQTEPDPSKTFAVEVGRDYVDNQALPDTGFVGLRSESEARTISAWLSHERG